MALGAALDASQHGSILLGPVEAANMFLYQAMSASLAKVGLLSSTGRSRLLDADTDGYLREEGGASLVIRSELGSLQTVVRNHDGRTASFTVPSGLSKRRCLEAA